MSDIERRAFLCSELRAEDGEGDGLPTIVGHAAVFNQRSEDLGGWFEVIVPGAFDRALESDDVRALVDHDPSKIIGRIKAKTLELRADDVGLFSTIKPPDTVPGRDIMTSIRRGDVDSMSFSFTVDEDGQEIVFLDDGTMIRKVFNVTRLFDVSPVSFPAYVDTDVSVRSMLEYQKAHSDIDSRVVEMLAQAKVQGARRRIAKPKTVDPNMERMQRITDDMKKKHGIT